MTIINELAVGIILGMWINNIKKVIDIRWDYVFIIQNFVLMKYKDLKLTKIHPVEYIVYRFWLWEPRSVIKDYKVSILEQIFFLLALLYPISIVFMQPIIVNTNNTIDYINICLYGLVFISYPIVIKVLMSILCRIVIDETRKLLNSDHV